MGCIAPRNINFIKLSILSDFTLYVWPIINQNTICSTSAGLRPFLNSPIDIPVSRSSDPSVYRDEA